MQCTLMPQSAKRMDPPRMQVRTCYIGATSPHYLMNAEFSDIIIMQILLSWGCFFDTLANLHMNI